MERDHLQQRLRARHGDHSGHRLPQPCSNPGAGSPRLQGRARGCPGDRGGPALALPRWRHCCAFAAPIRCSASS
jgi:hypothetical protein